MGHDTIWRSKQPGEKLSAELLNVSDEMGDGGGALLVNPGGVPDWVRDPAGNQVRVIALVHLSKPRPCGKCGADLPVGHEVVVAEVHGDPSKVWYVYACSRNGYLDGTDGCGFVWEQRAA